MGEDEGGRVKVLTEAGLRVNVVEGVWVGRWRTGWLEDGLVGE